MSKKSPQWAVQYQPCDGEVFRFSFCGSGAGACWDDRYRQEVRFSWNPNQLGEDRADEAVTHERLTEIADALFWPVINPQLQVRIVTPQEIGSLENAPVAFESGSRTELERETGKILYSCPNIWLAGMREVWVAFQTKSEHEKIAPRVLCDRFALQLGNKVNERDRSSLVERLTVAVRQNVPVGEYLCHRVKAGSLYRINSYQWQPKIVWIVVSTPHCQDFRRSGLHASGHATPQREENGIRPAGFSYLTDLRCYDYPESPDYPVCG